MRLAIAFTLLLWSVDAQAQQIVESAGSRALGMGGAFVAVADDPTAGYWNPAGLVKGPPGAMTIEWSDFRIGNQKGPVSSGLESRSSKLVSLGTWPIGLSYGQFRTAQTVVGPADGIEVKGLTVSQAGATILQSVAQGLVVGATLKYMRG